MESTSLNAAVSSQGNSTKIYLTESDTGGTIPAPRPIPPIRRWINSAPPLLRPRQALRSRRKRSLVHTHIVVDTNVTIHVGDLAPGPWLGWTTNGFPSMVCKRWRLCLPSRISQTPCEQFRGPV